MIRFSVVIPTRNRPEALAACLRSFAALDYPRDRWELLVVNDGGRESFRKIDPAAEEALPLRRIHTEPGGPARARNLGVRQSRGTLIAFTDDDCRVAPDWLARFEGAFAGGRWDALGGRSLNPEPNNSAAAAWHVVTAFLYEHFRDELGNSQLLITNNAAFRRDALAAVGGFDERFALAGGEDTELSHRLSRRGFSLGYCPEAEVWHHQIGLTPFTYARQQFRYGRGTWRVRQAARHAGQSEPRPATARRFGVALSEKLWRDRQPLRVWALIFLSQLMVYPLGIRYEQIRSYLEGTGRRS